LQAPQAPDETPPAARHRFQRSARYIRRLRGSYGAAPGCSFHRPPNRWNVPCVLLESSAKCCAWAQHRQDVDF
ncbi:50S ribosomal protein L29, partial [Dysosmobacter welbionis]